MFLALRELRFARTRFALMGAVIALIATLMVMLSGLASGLVRDGVSGLQKLPIDAVAFGEGTKTDSAFSRSTVDLSQVDIWKTRNGVADAAPLGNALVNAHTDTDVPVDLALFGVEPGSFIAPGATIGSALSDADKHGIVISSTLIDDGVNIGDTITIDRLGTELEVIGATADQRTFGHVDIAYTTLPLWQEVHAGAAKGESVRASAYQEASAVAIRATKGADLDLAGGDRAAKTSSMSLKTSFGASPGYTAETSTLSLIKGFLYAISALVVGAFFTVWTIQRRQEIAVVRAMGASTWYLLKDGLAQAVIVLAVFSAIGIAVGIGFGTLIPGEVPFALEARAIVIAGMLLIALGTIGAATAITRIASVDPLDALGGQR